MAAAPGNRAGKPPEITLPVAENRAVSIYPKLWILNSRLSWLMKKVPIIVPQKSATKCDNSKMHEGLLQGGVTQKMP